MSDLIQRPGDSPTDRRRGPILWVEAAPAWLASAILHLAALLLLALLALGAADDLPLSLLATAGEDATDALDDDALLEAEDASIAKESLPEADTLSALAFEPLASIAPQAPVSLPTAGTLTSGGSLGPAAALSGRAPGQKAALLKALGGTAESEEAVLRGLLWLQRRQKSDGGWSLVGPFADGVPPRRENRLAATAMALLAFQGAGKLPTSPRNDFGPTVEKGWEWLLERQQPDGSFYAGGGPSNHRYYTDAQCSIALCELLAMSGDESYRGAATRAVARLVDAQGELGGWKYQPNSRSDLSVTGWVLMALKSARMAGVPVSSSVFADIERFLDSVSRGDAADGAPRGSRYVYEKSDTFISEAIPTLTAVGLLCRQYLGWDADDPRVRSGVRFLLTHPPRWADREADAYYWYYASQACLHAGGPEWPKWNGVMRDFLIEKQQRRGRPEPGSWSPDFDIWGRDGGRLYTTCLSIYTLEVYYRHLPLYQQRAVR